MDSESFLDMHVIYLFLLLRFVRAESAIIAQSNNFAVRADFVGFVDISVASNRK